MKIEQLYYPLDQSHISDGTPARQVLAIGDFDGVHRGHRHVIERALAIACEHRMTAAIMTFNPHPREVLGDAKYSRYLAPTHDKMALFAELGVDVTYVVSFDHAFSRVSPEAFVERMLVPLNLHTVVVGFDFTFGHQGQGTAATLKQLCEGRMNVVVAEPFLLDGEKVSSTLIREQLHLGRLDKIPKYLGRYYAISGIVVHGDKRGQKLGFPTANLEITAPYVIPGNGVYAVRVHIDGQVYQGVMNIGKRPTLREKDPETTLEVHVIDFEGDLYGAFLKIEFIEFLRAERRFESLEQLAAQIRRDKDRARHLLSRL